MNKYPIKNNIEIVPYISYGKGKHNLKKELHLANTPIEIKIHKDIFRVVPMYKDVAVNSKGRVILVSNRHYAKTYNIDGYKSIKTKDYVNNISFSLRINRLVAMAWVPNDDYVTKNVVDHIDNNKLNNNKNNLRWLSQDDNVSASVHSGLERFSVKNMTTNKIWVMNSIRAIINKFNLDRTNIRVGNLPKVFAINNQDYIVYDNYKNPKNIMMLYLDAKYRYKVYRRDKESRAKYFNTIREVYIEYNVPSSNIAVTNVKAHLELMGYVFIVLKSNKQHIKYDIKNLITGEEYCEIGRNDILEITGVHSAKLNRRVRKKLAYGKPFGPWVLKLSLDKEYSSNAPEISYIYTLHKNGIEDHNFQSLRKLSKYLKVTRETVKRYIQAGKQIMGFTIIVDVKYII